MSTIPQGSDQGGEPGHLTRESGQITKFEWHNREVLNYDKVLVLYIVPSKKYARSGPESNSHRNLT